MPPRASASPTRTGAQFEPGGAISPRDAAALGIQTDGMGLDQASIGLAAHTRDTVTALVLLAAVAVDAVARQGPGA